MANETQIVSKGWAWAWLSRKPHYFINGRSLCGKWVLFSDMLEQESGKRSPDDCAVCRKKLDRLAEAAALAAAPADAGAGGERDA